MTKEELRAKMQERLAQAPENSSVAEYVRYCVDVMVDIIAEALADK